MGYGGDFGSLPFLLSAQNFNFSDAFFESMSGITTTGATIISDLDNSPKVFYYGGQLCNGLVELERCYGNYNITLTKSWRNADYFENGGSR